MNEIRDIHNPFIIWLHERGIPFHRNRPDKRTTAIKGDPDFLLTWCSYCVYIECKVPGRKLSKDQEKRIAYLRKAGNKVVITYSLQECIEAAQGIFCQGEQKNDGAGRTEPQSESFGMVPAFTPVPDQTNLFIANVFGTDWVMAGESFAGGLASMVRRPTPEDIRNLPRK